MSLKSPTGQKQNESSGGTTKKTQVILFLEKHQYLTDFLIIDSTEISPSKKPFPTYRDNVHRQNLKKLKNLNESRNSTFLNQPDLSQITRPLYMQHNISSIYYKIQFLIYKFQYYNEKVKNNFKNYVSSLIKLYESLLSNNANLIEVVTVDFDKLVAFLQKVPEKIKRIRFYYIHLIQEFSKEVKKSTKNAVDLRKDLVDILLQTKYMVDSSLNFFCPTPLQENFESIIFSPQFGVSDYLNQIIDKEVFGKLTAPELIQRIIKLNNQIIQTHKLKKEDNTTLIITFLFRMIFNEVYPMIKIFSLPEFNFDLLLKLKDLTLKEIGVPIEYCPIEFASEECMNDSPRNTFRNDVNYSLASVHIEFISFFTNPLDILHQLSAALHEIEKAAMIYKVQNVKREKKKKNENKSSNINDTSNEINNSDDSIKKNDDDNNSAIVDADFSTTVVEDGLSEFLFPFDVTFALFISTILASDVPEFMRIAAFTDQYSPTFGLCASFEFALAKLKTVSIYMQNLAQQMIEKETESSRESKPKNSKKDENE